MGGELNMFARTGSHDNGKWVDVKISLGNES